MVEVLDPFKVQSNKIEVKDPFLADEDEKEAPTAPVEQPEEKPFDAGQYVTPMGLLASMGITNYRTDNEVYRALSQTPEFRDADTATRRRMYNDAIDAHNLALYEAQGGNITQQITDAEGNTRNYLVPTPQMRNIDRVLGETGGEIFRSGVGGALQTAKTALQSAEYVADALVNPLGINEGEYFKENFPTLPPESTADEIGQEVISTMVGGATGAGLADKISKAYNVTPKMATWVAKQWSKVNRKGKTPEELGTAANALVNTVLLGTGANIGATITSPSEAEPLFGDDIIEAIGLEADDNPNLSIFADNVAFSGAIMTLAKAAKEAGGLLKKTVVGYKGIVKNSRDADIGLSVAVNLDPNLIGVPPEVLADRVRILGEVLQKNKNFASELLSDADVPLSTPTALREGVKEYVDRAYAFSEPLYDNPEDFIAFKEKLMGDMVSKMVDLRRQNVSSTQVREQEGKFLEGMGGALTATAEGLGGEVAVQAAAKDITQPTVDALRTSLDNQTSAETLLGIAEVNLNDAATQNEIILKLKDALRNNALGSDSTQRAALERLTGPELFAAWKRSRDAYKTAFEELPDVELNNEEFLDLIQEASSALNVIDEVTIANQVKNQPFKALIDIAKGDAAGLPEVSSRADLLEALAAENLTLTQVFKDIRPRIVQRIDQLLDAKQPADALIDLKDGIDAMVAESGSPEFRQALDLFEQHKRTFADTKPLRAFDKEASRVVESTGKGLNDTYEMGRRALEESFGSTNSAWIEPFMVALRQADSEVTDELAEAFVGQSMMALAATLQSGARVTSDQIKAAMQPYLIKLETVSPDTVRRFGEIVQDLQAAESGLVQANTVLNNAKKAYAETKKAAQNKAVSRLIYDLAGQAPRVDEAPAAAFERIFNNTQAPNFLPELMDEAEAAGPLAVEGIKSAFLTNLAETLRIGKVVASGAADPSKNIRAVSASKVASILEDPSSPVLKSLQIVFRDSPDTAAQVFRLLEIHDIAAGGKSMRGEVFGSTTNYDAQLKKLMDRVVTLRYGVLNTKATIVRNLADAITKGSRQKVQEAANATIADIAAYPEEFARILDLVAAGQERSATQIMIDLSLRAGYISQDDVLDPIDDQMREAMPQ